jgi:hypothetical protein
MKILIALFAFLAGILFEKIIKRFTDPPNGTIYDYEKDYPDTDSQHGNSESTRKRTT